MQELIERHAEGEYWDFKQQWHSCNADLLHDIIFMANSPANRDCYIIIGVEDGSYNILGVSDENRKNQQNIIDLLRQKPSWAGGYIPEVYAKTIYIMWSKAKDVMKDNERRVKSCESKIKICNAKRQKIMEKSRKTF